MTIKFWRLVLIYTLAAIIALTGYAFAAHRQLDRLRLTAGFESARAFEAAVSAAEGLSETLTKISFVTDPAEKETALRLLGNKFYPDPEEVEREIEKFLDKVCILKMSIDHMTGKLINES